MTENMVMELGRGALVMALMLSLPLLVVSLVIGVLVGLLQAITQVHEMTLTFVPKILGMFLVLALLGPWMLQQLLRYVVSLFGSLPQLVR